MDPYVLGSSIDAGANLLGGLVAAGLQKKSF